MQEKLSIISRVKSVKHTHSTSKTRRSSRRRRKSGPHDTTPHIIHVQKLRTLSSPTFCYKIWCTSHLKPVPPNGCDLECINDWQLLDNPSDVRHAIARDAMNGSFIVAKISPRQARHLAGKKNFAPLHLLTARSLLPPPRSTYCASASAVDPS